MRGRFAIDIDKKTIVECLNLNKNVLNPQILRDECFFFIHSSYHFFTVSPKQCFIIHMIDYPLSVNDYFYNSLHFQGFL